MTGTTLKNQLLIVLFFVLAAAITWWFIQVSPMYDKEEQMLLSFFIAGAKWIIQLIAAYFLLQEKKWEFMRQVAFTCLVGSVLLLPYCFAARAHAVLSPEFFGSSLLLSVLTMAAYYYRGVKKTNVSWYWWYGWLLCLAITIGLQFIVVF